MIKTLENIIVFQNKYITVENNRVQFENWEIDKYLRVFPNWQKKSRVWVSILCINQNEEILLIKNYRYAIDKAVWEIPRGRYDWEETAIEAGKRELEEETWIKNILQEKYLWNIYIENWVLASEWDLVLIQVENNHEIKLQREEHIIDYKWLSVEEIKKEIFNWNLKDPFLETALLRYLFQK